MPKKLIIIGAGFAGIQLARHIDESLFEVLLIDKLNHHQFQPLFYQVATSQIEPSSISFPIRSIVRNKKNVQVRLAEVEQIIPAQKEVKTNIGSFRYDVLVIATGCKTNFFGNSNIEKHALTLKSTYEAIMVRNHVIRLFEAFTSATEAEKKLLENIVIVGGGPTGVELAGSFAEIKKHILPRDYPDVDFSRLNILLIEGGKYLLNALSRQSKAAAEKDLCELGVNLLMETTVKDYNGEELVLSDGQLIYTRTVIWAAGVTGNALAGLPDECRARGGRLQVNRYNQVKGFEEVYAIGDICLMETPKYPGGHPQLANVAIHQAKNLAINLKAKVENKAQKEYEYKDLGAMATIGKHRAVVDIKSFHIGGYLAWYIWMFLHLMLILSVKNKLIIFINWAWAYFNNDSSLRLILGKNGPMKSV